MNEILVSIALLSALPVMLTIVWASMVKSEARRFRKMRERANRNGNSQS